MPDRWLVTHRAPPDLVQRALQRRERPARWPVAVAMAAGLAMGALGGYLAARSGAPRSSATAPLGQPVALAAPAEASTTVPVRLVYHADQAGTVNVAGSCNGWDPSATPMIRGQDGNFYVVLPLNRGRHEYMFVVDGERWLPDPTAVMLADDGFGQQNAILEI